MSTVISQIKKRQAMANLVIFLLTSLLVGLGCLGASSIDNPFPVKKFLTNWTLASLLFLPLNINGTVITVFGSGVSEKGFYSVFSPYQHAGGNAVAILGSFDQEAGNNATVILGIVGYQRATRDAFTFVGVSGYQKAGHLGIHAMGINGFQDGNGVGTIFGLSGYQKSYATDPKDGGTLMLIGLTGHQKGPITELGLGLIGFQNSSQKASTNLGLTFYQKAGHISRSFAVYSDLSAPVEEPTKK